jgi:hypothetical protein
MADHTAVIEANGVIVDSDNVSVLLTTRTSIIIARDARTRTHTSVTS